MTWSNGRECMGSLNSAASRRRATWKATNGETHQRTGSWQPECAPRGVERVALDGYDPGSRRRSTSRFAVPRPPRALARGRRWAAPGELGETGEVAVEGNQLASMLEGDRRELCVGDEIP